MSRRYAEPLWGEEYTVIIGWDRPLGTYFCKVLGPKGATEPEVAFGETPREYPDLAPFVRRVARFAKIDDKTLLRLAEDKEREGDSFDETILGQTQRPDPR
jgi:hypothetical protein